MRERLLDELAALVEDEPALPAHVAQLARHPFDGRAKLWLIWRLLGLRERSPSSSATAATWRSPPAAERCEHLLASARQHGEHTLIVVVARLFSQLESEVGKLPVGESTWGDTAVEIADALGVPEGARFLDVLTGRTLRITSKLLSLPQLFSHWPAAALWRLPDNID